MRSVPDDRTARAIIRDEALRLFAARGPAEAMVRHLPPGSPVPAYLRRLLLADGDAGRQLFRRMYEISTMLVDSLVKAGLAAPGADPAVRVAFLMANDLAVLLLREHLADVLGVDPLSGER